MSDISEYSTKEDPIHVTTRIIFLRIGELDTQSEKFHAHVAIEARWFVTSNEERNNLLSFISADDHAQFTKGKIVKLTEDFPDKYWHPKLFLLNVSRDRDEVTKYSMKRHQQGIQIYQFMDVHGHFYCPFDLHQFPTDIQELSVSIGSALLSNEVILEADSYHASAINHEAFVDQQEWLLYDHVETRSKLVKGFFFQNDDDNELDTPGHEQTRSIIILFCHAARRSTYFDYNGYGLIFLITMTAFNSFAIPPDVIRSRLGITCTLLLTSIAFRWTISQNLPKICYLTTIDRYALISIFVLITLCIWHSVIATVAYTHGYYESLTSSSQWTWIDRYVLAGLFSLYILVHIIMVVWHWRGPLAKRKQMVKRDEQYHQAIKKMKSKGETTANSSGSEKQRGSDIYFA